jgi:Amino acid permease
MISERLASGMLPRVLNSFDMTIVFVAIVLFIVQASAMQQARQAAFTYWVLGFLLFLIPGALVTAQLGRMFPQEGSLYVWTQKALGLFWDFFAGFCAWWPGILVMIATGDAVITIWQFVDPGSLAKAWEQGLVVLAVLWFSAGMSLLHLRMTQTYVNLDVLRARDPLPAGDRGAAEHGRRDRAHALDQALPLLGLARLRGRDWPDPDLVLRLEHRRLQLLVLPAALRIGTRAANAGAARHRQGPDEGAGLCDSHADRPLIAVRRRALQPVGERGQQPEGVLVAPGGGDRDLVPLDGAPLRRHLPRQAGLPGGVRSPWTGLFTATDWRIWLAVPCGISVAVAVAIYGISEVMRRRERVPPQAAPTV